MTKKTLFDKLRKLIKPEKGQSIVEFALVVPLVLVLFMGVFDFGWILHQQIQMDNATRLGARRGAVGVGNTEILAKMQENTTFDLPADAFTIEVRGSDGVDIGDNTDRTPDNLIYIKIERPQVDLLTPLGNFIEGMTTISLQSEAEFLIE